MPHHGSETFFVEGEGVLGEAGQGRHNGAATHALIAGLGAASQFHFSRMGPKGTGKQPSEALCRRLGEAMTLSEGRDGRIPAGFTYLGQFLDHDLTFDKTVVTLGTNVTPAAMIQGRSPALDLDSIYGAGPADPESAKFYEADGLHLKIGRTFDDGPGTFQGHDLPRGKGSSAAQKRVAVIPEPRNDENVPVGQTHVAMLHFHNRVVDTLPASVPAAQKFARAREKVVKHYQWMIRHDYLPRICAQGVVNDVFNHGRKAFEVGVPETKMPTMPIEFSVAAFRLGHSMVREIYHWNKFFDPTDFFYLFDFSGLGGDLAGNPHLASSWVADFRRLYSFSEVNAPNLEVPKARFNRAKRIDTSVAHVLHDLPSRIVNPSIPFGDKRLNLAFRNLMRGRMVTLASGQQMARFLKNKGVNVTPLTRKQLRDGSGGADLGTLTAGQRDALFKNTPLWFYVLRESELNNGRLKGVGARIVAETFHRAMEGSRFSIVRDDAFRPSLGQNNQTFRMTDLLKFAYQGKKSELAPLG